MDLDYALTLFQHMILLFANRVELFYAIHCFCSIICLILTMHRYTNWLLCHYRPMLKARHLARWDMMRSLAQQNQTSNLSVGLKQLPSVKGTQWFYKKWNFSFAANQGFRPYMEDRMCYSHEPQTHNMSMYSLFDGHGGAHVADFLEQNFNRRVLLMLEEKEQRMGQDIYKDDELIEAALIDEVERIDADVSVSRISTAFTGSTLISAFVNHNRYLTIINVGDSRCVGADFKGNCVPLSFDHKPHHPEERSRIERAGGFVEHYGVERVQGILAVSRAFGDTDLKRHRFVISKPDITRVDLDKQPLRYIILASDGFWDVVSNHEAILEVNYLLEKRGEIIVKQEPEPQVEDKPKPAVEPPKPAGPVRKRPIDSPTNKHFGLAVFQAVVTPPIKKEKSEVVEKKPITSEKKKEVVEEGKAGNVLLDSEGPIDSLAHPNVPFQSDLLNSAKSDPTQVDIAGHLVKLALKRRSPDNISVFFVRLDKF